MIITEPFSHLDPQQFGVAVDHNANVFFSVCRRSTNMTAEISTPVEAMDVEVSQSSNPKPTLSTLPPELKALIVEMIEEVDHEDDFEEDWEEEDEDEEHDCSSHGPGGHDHGAHGHSHGPSHSHSHGAKEHDCSSHAPGEHGHSHGDEEEEEDVGIDSAMWAIALVNREFSALAQQYLWRVRCVGISIPLLWLGLIFFSVVPFLCFCDAQEVSIAEDSTDQIGRFLVDIVPRHAHHVRAIQIQQDHATYDPYDAPSDVAHPLHSRWAALPEIVGESPHDHGHRFRRVILGEILSSLPNLSAVDVDILDTPGLPNERTEVTTALRAVGPKLLDLSLHGVASDDDDEETTTDFDEGYIGTFLSSFPNLIRLQLDIPTLLPSGRDTLFSALVSLTSLETLMIDGGEFVNSSFADLAWTAPLQTLALSDCDDLSLPAFLTFVQKFSGTLTTLDLDDVPSSSIDADNLKYLVPTSLRLPHLEHLVVTTTHDEKFLALFAPATTALESLTIGFCPSIPYEAWEAFIADHHVAAGRLKEVVVEGGSELSEGQLESLEVFCFAKGIAVEIQEDEPDSDDEDGDDLEEWEDEGDEDGDDNEDDE